MYVLREKPDFSSSVFCVLLNIMVPQALTFIPQAMGAGFYECLVFHSTPSLSYVVGIILEFTQEQVFPLWSDQYFHKLATNPKAFLSGACSGLL